jgi:hypothetical protein
MGRAACLAVVAALAGCAKPPELFGAVMPKGCTESVAIDLPPRRSARLVDSTVELTLLHGATAELRLVSPLMAEWIDKAARESRDAPATATHVAGRDALLVMVTGRDGARQAKQLRAAIRTPRPDELARLHPRRVDLRAPRRLWSH